LFVKGDVERPPFIVIGFVGVQVLMSDEMRYRSGEHVSLWLKNRAQKPVEIRSFLNYTRYKFKGRIRPAG
jgi:hypothetical protein